MKKSWFPGVLRMFWNMYIFSYLIFLHLTTHESRWCVLRCVSLLPYTCMHCSYEAINRNQLYKEAALPSHPVTDEMVADVAADGKNLMRNQSIQIIFSYEPSSRKVLVLLTFELCLVFRRWSFEKWKKCFRRLVHMIAHSIFRLLVDWRKTHMPTHTAFSVSAREMRVIIQFWRRCEHKLLLSSCVFPGTNLKDARCEEVVNDSDVTDG